MSPKRMYSSSVQMIRMAWQAQSVIFTAILLSHIFQGFLPTATAWITKRLFDKLANGMMNNTIIDFAESLLPLLILQSVLAIVAQTSVPLNAYLNAELGRKLDIKTKTIVYGQIAKLDGLAYFETPEFHDTIRLATQGLQSGPSNILNIVMSLVRSILTVLSLMAVLLLVNPVIAIVSFFSSLPQLVIQIKMGHARFSLTFMNSPKERQAFYFNQILSSTRFIKEVRLFNLADHFLKRLLTTTCDVQSAQRKQQYRELKWEVVLNLLSSTASSGAIAAAIYQAALGHISLGDVALYITALGSVQSAVSTIVRGIANLNEKALFYKYVDDLLELPPALSIAESVQPVPTLQSSIELCDVSFRYTDAQPWVLRHVNLTIPKDKCLALVGLNGAGKTTLVKLLTRLYDPTEGQILWNGVDFRQFSPVELRQHVTAIFQDFVQYDLTAQENIGLGNVADMDNISRIQLAARNAGIHDWLTELPKGYHTVLSRWLSEKGEGVDLSGGQWQKMAIARLFMREADFLILDEPTVSLDAESENELYQRFAELTRNRTVLLISHRFSTMRIADIIAVIDGGKIIEYGSHKDLLYVGGKYARLYNMQARQYQRS